MTRVPAIVLLAIALVGATASTSATNATTQRFRVSLYFLADGETAVIAVRRTVVRRSDVPLARIALQQLLAGPDASARRQGLTSAIPAGAKILSFSIAQTAHGSTATVDFMGLPPLANASGVTVARIGTQVARTVIGLSDVTRVRIDLNGRSWSFRLMGGSVSPRAWDYQLLVGLSAGDFKALP